MKRERENGTNMQTTNGILSWKTDVNCVVCVFARSCLTVSSREGRTRVTVKLFVTGMIGWVLS